MAAHKDDKRPHLYSIKELEAAATQDEYWIAAMKEKKYIGYMHNHMPMYWGKKFWNGAAPRNLLMRWLDQFGEPAGMSLFL